MKSRDDRLVRTQQSLVAFLNAISEYYEGRPHDASPDSIMSQDVHDLGDPRPFLNAMTLSDLACQYTHNHLSLLASAIAKQPEPLTCCTLVRSTLETSAIGAWVVDPAIDTVERVARVFAVRFDSIVQNVKVLQCTDGISRSDIDRTNAQKEVLAHQAGSFGVPVDVVIDCEEAVVRRFAGFFAMGVQSFRHESGDILDTRSDQGTLALTFDSFESQPADRPTGLSGLVVVGNDKFPSRIWLTASPRGEDRRSFNVSLTGLTDTELVGVATIELDCITMRLHGNSRHTTVITLRQESEESSPKQN